MNFLIFMSIFYNFVIKKVLIQKMVGVRLEEKMVKVLVKWRDQNKNKILNFKQDKLSFQSLFSKCKEYYEGHCEIKLVYQSNNRKRNVDNPQMFKDIVNENRNEQGDIKDLTFKAYVEGGLQKIKQVKPKLKRLAKQVICDTQGVSTSNKAEKFQREGQTQCQREGQKVSSVQPEPSKNTNLVDAIHHDLDQVFLAMKKAQDVLQADPKQLEAVEKQITQLRDFLQKVKTKNVVSKISIAPGLVQCKLCGKRIEKLQVNKHHDPKHPVACTSCGSESIGYVSIQDLESPINSGPQESAHVPPQKVVELNQYTPQLRGQKDKRLDRKAKEQAEKDQAEREAKMQIEKAKKEQFEKNLQKIKDDLALDEDQIKQFRQAKYHNMSYEALLQAICEVD